MSETRPVMWRDELAQLMYQHERWRARTINLIASENVMSPTVKGALLSDLLGRYADYNGRDLESRRYRGNAHIVELEQVVDRIARIVFRAEFVELRAIAGHLAGIAVLMAVCEPGDTILEIGRDGGGHREAGKFAGPPLTAMSVESLPFDASRYNVDVGGAVRVIAEKRPRAVILGSSNFLFPHPVRAIAEAVHAIPGSRLIYDGSHVMGFLAAGAFQDPLREGADVVFGSTHKTLPGPQGGIIFSNDEALMAKISAALYPALVTNHHAFRLPALGIALTEMRQWGREYVDQIVINSGLLGKALESGGVPVVAVAGSYTQTHTLLAKVAALGHGDEIARRLEAAEIVVGAAHLPNELGTEGLRIGTQEVTRRGATGETMLQIAALMTDCILGRRKSEAIAVEARALAATLNDFRFTWTA